MRETKNGKGLTIAKTDSTMTFGDVDIKFQPSRPDDALGKQKIEPYKSFIHFKLYLF
jgi:hypothetical protein